MSELIIKIKKLDPNAVIPSYAKDGDAGMDLTAISRKIVSEADYHYLQYGTGLSIEIPKEFVGLLFPRSSISKTGMILANSIGVIDSGYRGEIQLRFKMNHDKNTVYQEGDKVAQLIIIPYPQIHLEEVEELSETERGDGGFGSTGK